MSRMVDNLIALRILKMLVAPFTESEAFKLGIIDAKGKMIRKPSTDQDKSAYNYLTKLVFNMKKIINRLPGGENKTKSLVAALWLIKEHYETNNRSTAMMQEKFVAVTKLLENKVSLVEEEIIVKKFLEEDGVANVTGAAVSTDAPKIGPKDIKKYKQGQASTIAGMTRRPKPVTEDLDESWKDTMKWIPHPEHGYALSKHTSNYKSAYVFNDSTNAEQKQKHFGGKIRRNVAGNRILVKKKL